VDRDGVSPELGSDIEELNRRRAGIAVGWATVEARSAAQRTGTSPHPMSGMGFA
jgi:hypothetical protein